jgi:signal peptidase II
MVERFDPFAKALAVTGGVVAFDQITKQIAIHEVAAGDAVQLIGGIEITNVRNPGVAFGLLSGSDVAILIFTAAALAALAIHFALHAQRAYLWLVVGLLAGGAVSNLADRLRTGKVIDFIDFPGWPAFNLADVAIVVGAVGLALTLLGAERSIPDHG